MSKNEGKKFEEDFSNCFIKENIFIYRLKDSASAWNSGQVSRFTVHNACDFIAFNPFSKNILMIECKSFLGKSCPFSNIKLHQINEMYYYSTKYSEVEACFIFNFRSLDKTYAVNVMNIKKLYDSKERKSVSLKFCEKNGVLIEQIKKKTRFSYNIYNIFNKSIDYIQ